MKACNIQQPASALRPISEIWAERERNGRPIKVYSAYPLIGRGIIHNWIPHAEVEKRFTKAPHISFFTRLKWFIEKETLLFWFLTLIFGAVLGKLVNLNF